tara:strand:+ start:272 stop:607 length:336 start_codon:yes stop_codon:yes gene_type:complete
MNQFDKDEAAAVKAITMLIKHGAEHDFSMFLDEDKININKCKSQVADGWDGTLLITNVPLERNDYRGDLMTLDIEDGSYLDKQFSNVAYAFKCQVRMLEVCGHLAVKVSHA